MKVKIIARDTVWILGSRARGEVVEVLDDYLMIKVMSVGPSCRYNFDEVEIEK